MKAAQAATSLFHPGLKTRGYQALVLFTYAATTPTIRTAAALTTSEGISTQWRNIVIMQLIDYDRSNKSIETSLFLMETTIITDRSFTPCSMYEPVKFGVCLTLSADDGITQSQARKSGLAISKELLKIGAMPVISGLRKSANLEEVNFGGVSGAILVPTGITIAQVQLRFSQTWQVNKPVRSSISQGLSHQIDDCDGAIASAVSEGWAEIITEVYESVADVLIADGRWGGKLAA